MSFYIVGWNMPGYLPEMEPYAVKTAEEAKQAMIDDILRHADFAADGGDENEAEELSSVAEDLNLTNVDEGWSYILSNTSYWINRVHGDFGEMEGEEV